MDRIQRLNHTDSAADFAPIRPRYFKRLFRFTALCSCLIGAGLIGAPEIVRESQAKPIEDLEFVAPAAGEESPRRAVYQSDQVVESIVFAGDGGKAEPRALELLRKEIGLSPAKPTVVFLGDNVYDRGIVPAGHPDYQQAKQRLFAQIDLVKTAGARGIFIPGNHDWDYSGPEGWNAIKRQQEMVESALGAGSFAPPGGCPGPVVAYESEQVRLIAMDSQWWVHKKAKPKDAATGCRAYSTETIAGELGQLAASKLPNRREIVVSHHPMESSGKHGIVDRCPNGRLCRKAVRMRKKIAAPLTALQPALCIAGHDHTLQLLEKSGPCKLYGVSGTLSSITRFASTEDLLLGFTAHGFFRIDVLRDGRAAITLVYLPRKGGEPKRISLWMD